MALPLVGGLKSSWVCNAWLCLTWTPICLLNIFSLSLQLLLDCHASCLCPCSFFSWNVLLSLVHDLIINLAQRNLTKSSLLCNLNHFLIVSSIRMCVYICLLFLSMASTYKQPFAHSWLSEKACWTNRWRTWLFYLGNIFLTLQEEALLLLSGFIYPPPTPRPAPQRICLKNSQVWCLWLLWTTPRFLKGTFSCISAVRGTFSGEFEKLPFQDQLYWYMGLYDTVWEICHVFHGETQIAKSFERMVVCVVRIGDCCPLV